jgi:hypothetical protein
LTSIRWGIIIKVSLHGEIGYHTELQIRFSRFKS